MYVYELIYMYVIMIRIYFIPQSFNKIYFVRVGHSSSNESDVTNEPKENQEKEKENIHFRKKRKQQGVCVCVCVCVPVCLSVCLSLSIRMFMFVFSVSLCLCVSQNVCMHNICVYILIGDD